MNHIIFIFIKTNRNLGIPLWSCGQDSILSLPKAWVQSPVGEIRSCKPHSAARKKKKTHKQTNKKAPQKPVRASKSKECKLSWGNPRGQMQLCLQTSWTSGQDRYGDVCTLSYLSGTQACLPQFRPSSLLSLLDAKATHFSPIFTSDRVDSLLGPLPDSQGRDSSPA